MATARASTSISPIRCPSRSSGCARRSIRSSRRVANLWNEQLGRERRFPPTLEAWLRECHASGPNPADAAAAEVRRRRLQLPAPRSLRRDGLSAAGDGAAERTRPRLRRRRIHAGRAAAAPAVGWRGRSAQAGRCGRCSPSTSTPGAARADGTAGRCAMAYRACARGERFTLGIIFHDAAVDGSRCAHQAPRAVRECRSRSRCWSAARWDGRRRAGGPPLRRRRSPWGCRPS